MSTLTVHCRWEDETAREESRLEVVICRGQERIVASNLLSWLHDQVSGGRTEGERGAKGMIYTEKLPHISG